MVDRNRPNSNRPRSPRPPGRGPGGPGGRGPAGPARAEGAAPAGLRAIPATNYREHLQSEHNARVVEEPGWPTEVKRYFLVRDKDGKEQNLASFVGTLPQALAHFYHYFHPQPSR